MPNVSGQDIYFDYFSVIIFRTRDGQYGSEAPIIIVGNKSDLEHLRSVPKAEGGFINMTIGQLVDRYVVESPHHLIL